MLYKKLKQSTYFNVVLFSSVLVNTIYMKLVIVTDLLVSVLTILSIVFGFVVAAICNLFGRKITFELSVRRSSIDGGISQLQEIRRDFSQLLGCSMLLITISIGILVTKDNQILHWLYVSDICRYIGSAIYLFLLFFVMLALFSYSIILMNFLINETVVGENQ